MPETSRSEPTLQDDQELAADLSLRGNQGARGHGNLIHVLQKAAQLRTPATGQLVGRAKDLEPALTRPYAPTRTFPGRKGATPDHEGTRAEGAQRKHGTQLLVPRVGLGTGTVAS